MFPWACGVVLGRRPGSGLEEGAMMAASGEWLRSESGPALDRWRIGEASDADRKVWRVPRFAAADRWTIGALLLLVFGSFRRSMGFGCLDLRSWPRIGWRGSAGVGDPTLVVERQEWWGCDGADAVAVRRGVICWILLASRLRLACRLRRHPWWIADLSWWIAALDVCGRWWLGRVYVFGPRGLLGFLCLVLSVVFVCLSCLVFCSFWVFLTSNKSLLFRVRVVWSGLCAGYAWSALGWRRVPCFGKWSLSPSCSSVSTLGRWRVPCFVKWSLPPSGRVKPCVAGCFVQWQHDGKAVRMELLISNTRVADQVIFLSCHRCVTSVSYVKAIRVASSALFANWCLSGYMCVVEAPGIIPGSSPDVLFIWGLGLMSPPMYSVVSLMKV